MLAMRLWLFGGRRCPRRFWIDCTERVNLFIGSENNDLVDERQKATSRYSTWLISCLPRSIQGKAQLPIGWSDNCWAPARRLLTGTARPRSQPCRYGSASAAIGRRLNHSLSRTREYIYADAQVRVCRVFPHPRFSSSNSVSLPRRI
jgi:hypothetical protein